MILLLISREYVGTAIEWYVEDGNDGDYIDDDDDGDSSDTYGGSDL